MPWVGQWGFDASLVLRVLVAALALGAVVWSLPKFAASTRIDDRLVVGLCVLSGVVLTYLLARAGPADTRWPSLRFGYGAHTHLVDDWGGPAAFLRRYVDRQPFLTAHLRAHPPGLVLLLWLFEQFGLAGRTFHLILMLVAGAVANVAALVAVHDVAGRWAMRAATPFVVLSPVLVWRTNPDVIFAAIGLVAVALVVRSTTTTRLSSATAVAGGAVFGLALLFSFGLMPLAIPMAAVAWYRRVGWPLMIAAAATLVVIALPAVWGYSWLAGLLETRHQYAISVAHVRGYRYWLLGNAAIYAAMLGPALFVALSRMRPDALRMVGLAGIGCAVLAGLSGLSSAETERIWQPFVPLALVAGGVLWMRDDQSFDARAARGWLALQGVVIMLFQTFLWTRV